MGGEEGEGGGSEATLVDENGLFVLFLFLIGERTFSGGLERSISDCGSGDPVHEKSDFSDLFSALKDSRLLVSDLGFKTFSPDNLRLIL